MLRAPTTITEGLATYSARSEFNTESGAITGDSLAVGGTWAGAGDADDFSVSGGLCTRTASVDGDVNTGRYATASSPSPTDVAVKIRFKFDLASTSSALLGAIARYTDTSNWLIAGLSQEASAPTFVLKKRVAGSVTTIQSVSLGSSYRNVNTWHDVMLVALATGYTEAWLDGQKLISTTDSVLATGGTLASGKVGMYDADTGSGATRTFDGFNAWVPSLDAVCFASQSLELNTQGITREDSTGSAYGPVSIQNGDIPRMPNRSSAGTVEFVGKLSRGDFATQPDPGIDDISVRVYRRASYLLLPS